MKIKVLLRKRGGARARAADASANFFWGCNPVAVLFILLKEISCTLKAIAAAQDWQKASTLPRRGALAGRPPCPGFEASQSCWLAAGGRAARRRPVWRGRSQPAGSTLWLARARLRRRRRWVSPPGSAPHLGGEAARGQRAGRERSAHLLPSRRRAQRGETLTPARAAPADWLLAEGGLREACDG